MEAGKATAGWCFSSEQETWLLLKWHRLERDRSADLAEGVEGHPESLYQAAMASSVHKITSARGVSAMES